jgi:hypothetical protein
MKNYWFALILLLGWIGCQEDPVYTPEEVVRKWFQAVDNNEFEEARALSSAATIENFIRLLESLPPEFLESSVMDRKLSNMKCIESGETAKCTFLADEMGEQYQDSVDLVKVKGDWLVDIQEVPTEEDEQMLEEMIQELMKEGVQ